MHAFLAAELPCFALGVVGEQQRQGGFLALRPPKSIPPDIANAGFRFGHALLGNAEFEVVQFVFAFYGFETYNVLVNPNNLLVQTVLTMMVHSSDYFFFVLNVHGSATTFQSAIGQEDVAGLKTNLPRIQRSTTTKTQYQKAVALFEKNPQPAGTLLPWVCQENAAYPDLTRDRLTLTPA
jgi:hypothetical protein